jgi:hypothetical protein
MDELLAFLRARLDEDEQAARDAMWCEDAGTWRTEPTPYGTRGAAQRWYIEDSLEDGVVSHVDPQASDDEGVARHIVRHDPARVLREVEAKRRLLEQFRLRGDSVRRTVQPATGGVWDDLLRMFALPYADHNDYREKWRP